MKTTNHCFTYLSTLLMGAALFCLVNQAGAQNPPPFGKQKMAGSQSNTGDTKAAGGNLSAADKKFMANAAKGGMMEVEGGKVAAQNGQNAEVKKFGNRMVKDHGAANQELMSIAAQKGVQLPNSKPSMKWKSDKAYMSDMVKDHEKDLAEFQKEASQGSDPDVKKFADKTSRVIAKHLEMAKDIDGKLK